MSLSFLVYCIRFDYDPIPWGELKLVPMFKVVQTNFISNKRFINVDWPAVTNGHSSISTRDFYQVSFQVG